MALAIGTQLGSMEVTALIGRGGMGEVYRAVYKKQGSDWKAIQDMFSSDLPPQPPPAAEKKSE